MRQRDDMTGFTVFGANGFIGDAVARELEASGQELSRPPRGVAPASLGDMGHVIFSVGITADFRSRPYDTMDAHVGLATRILAEGRYRSFLYLSSTRVYDGADAGSETARIAVDPADPSDLYNLSKLAGEALCLAHANPAVRVARLSNVFGARMFPDAIEGANFLAGVVGEAVLNNRIVLGTHPSSAKDYVHVDDVARALVLIAADGDQRLFNVASGRNVSHADIVARLAELTGCAVASSEDAPRIAYPKISTGRLARLFDSSGGHWSPAELTDCLPALVTAARQKWNIKEGAIA